MAEQSEVAKTGELAAPVPSWLRRAWEWLTAPRFVYKTTFLFGLLLVLAYLTLPGITGVASHWTLSFVKELGFAYAIAAILGFSIEEFNRIRHDLHEASRQKNLQEQAEHVIRLMREEHKSRAESFGQKVARSVIEAAYGATIPEPVIQAVARYVLQVQRVRHEFNARVELHRLSEVRERIQDGFQYANSQERAADEDYVVAIYTSRFTDENVSAAPLRLPIPVEIIKEGRELNGVDTLRSFKACLAEPGVQPWVDASSTGQLQEAGIEVVDTAAKLTFAYLTPELASRAKASIVFQYITVQDAEDEMIVMSAPPCVKAVLTVVHSPSLSVSVSSIHTEAEIEHGREPDWAPHERRWTLATALLPCQGFILNWQPTPVPSDTGNSAGTSSPEPPVSSAA